MNVYNGDDLVRPEGVVSSAEVRDRTGLVDWKADPEPRMASTRAAIIGR